MTMTSRERVQAAFEHTEPDRTPVFEYVLLSPVADQILGHVYAGDPANWNALVRECGWKESVRLGASDLADLARILGHDLLYVLPNPSRDAPAAIVSPAVFEPLRDDPVGCIRRRNQQLEESFAPPPDDRFLIFELLREELERRDLDLPIFAPAYEHGIWTDVALMQTMLLDPDVAGKHFELATQRAISWVHRYREVSVEMIGVGGDFAGNKPLISPELYRRFIVPEVRKVSRCVHSVGGLAINASDGNLWSVLDDFLFGCEVDGYMEIDVQAGMDLGRLKASYGDRVTLLGNLDCGTVLSFASERGVRQHTIDCLEAGWGCGGHILTASNAITGSVPLRNYLAAVNAYREYFGLPSVDSGSTRSDGLR